MSSDILATKLATASLVNFMVNFTVDYQYVYPLTVSPRGLGASLTIILRCGHRACSYGFRDLREFKDYT